MKLLSIFIPTYNRASILPNAVRSVSLQIESFNLQEAVDIIICNDCSPDDTKDYLETLKESYINTINRTHNLGMSANIFAVLTETCKSEWVLILTDDDTLESNILPAILKKCQELSNSNVPICLTPRYSYLSSGELHCIACQSFKHDTLIQPSPSAVGQIMSDGFILSGILLQPDKIDYSLWSENIENSMFPVILTGATLRNQHGYYWSNKIVNHTVLNECFWDRWGKTEIDREYRLFCDWIEAYSILATSYNELSSSEYDKFWRGANQKLKKAYSFYLFSLQSGMSGLVKLYGVYKASQMVVKTVFCSYCFWAICSACIKNFLKSLIKAIFLLRRSKFANWKTIVASLLVLLIALGHFNKKIKRR